MQLTYAFSELATGLRRNVSMTVAVIVTIFVSLTLVGMGFLLNAQAQKAEEYWGDRLQITVFMCTDLSTTANCVDGKVTDAQKAQVEQVLQAHPEVASWHRESSKEAYEKWRAAYAVDDATSRQVVASVKPSDMPESYWVKLEDPERFEGVKSEVEDLAGVNSVRDLREVLEPIYTWIAWLQYGAIGVALFLLAAAVLQVGNTIRLAALARRREIGIMRLVGASGLYIQMPFLLEALFAAVVGVALASAAILVFIGVVVNGQLDRSNIVDWVGWDEGLAAIGLIAAIGLLLTLVPTLLLTRKYLRV